MKTKYLTESLHGYIVTMQHILVVDGVGIVIQEICYLTLYTWEATI